MKSKNGNRQLDRRIANIAAGASVLAILAGGAGLMVLRHNVPDAALVMPWLIIYAAALLCVLGASFQLVMGQTAGQRGLLALWMCAIVAAVPLILSLLLWGTPNWLMFGETNTQYAAHYKTVSLVSASAGVVLAAGLSVLLVLASAGKSRLRYSSMVITSIGIVIALAVSANIAAQKDPYRVSVETLGRYRASGRTKKILRGVDVPLTLTCVYTAPAKEKTGRKSGAYYRQQVLELLNDMAYINKNIAVKNITSDAEKARLTERLRKQRNRRAGKHMKLLDHFRKINGKIVAELQAGAAPWTSLSDDSYLAQWNLPVAVTHMLTNMSKKLKETRKKVLLEMNKPLIDFKAVVKTIKEPIEKDSRTLSDFATTISAMSELPATVKKNKPAALASLDSCLSAIEKMVNSVGKESGAAPKDPTAALKAYIAASDKTVKAIRLARRVLDGVAGPKFTNIIKSSRYWIVKRNYLTDWYRQAANALARQQLNLRTVLQRMTKQTHADLVNQLRRELPKLLKSFKDADSAARKALDALASSDRKSDELMKRAKDGKLFARPKKALAKLLDEINKLPKKLDLPAEITGDNIVIVETPDKAEVVSFESVWPLKVKSRWGSNVEPKREFNGDSAIASTILHMTQKSFGTVYLTYFRPKVPPQMARTMPQAKIQPGNLNVVRRRLESANFDVEEWNLAEEDAPGASAKNDDNKAGGKTPKVLLILPPPPPQMLNPYMRRAPVPSFGPKQIDKIRREIDSGTPAIFLGYFAWPRQMSFFGPLTQPAYAWNKYLRSDWGIDVENACRVLQAIPDKTSPGLFRFDIQAFSYLPLSSFSDHPIGRPLQGRRVFWMDLCPVEAMKKLPAGVTVSPLLSVPADRRDLWATRNIAKLIQRYQMGESTISPDVVKGDITPPFDVALAAISTARQRKITGGKGKTETRKIKPSRIVVLGMGMSLIDGYLNTGVSVIGSDGSISMTDKPRANADVVINSAYWLIGREKYIAAGPASGKPIAQIPPRTEMALKIGYWIFLPGLIVGIGIVVSLLRKRG